MTGVTATRGWRFAIYGLYVILCVALQHAFKRTEFAALISLYGGLFILYAVLLRNVSVREHMREAVWLGIAVRALSLFAFPNLTDDYFRYMFDGQLTAIGISPYAYTPEQFATTAHMDPTGPYSSYFQQLNSLPYYSIYPPVCQAVFAIGAFIGGNNPLVHLIVIRLLLLTFEIGTILLLPRILELLKLPASYSLLYILNPLVILELSTNVHLEGIMIFFLCASLYYFLKQRLTFSALLFGAAVASKLWPLMLMPLLFRQLGFKGTMRYSIMAVGTAIILLFPMLLQYAHVAGSLNLYFQQFEFNGSVYYLLRDVFDKDVDYTAFSNMRASMPLITCILIVLFSCIYRKDMFINALIVVFSLYFLFATTVHPWYITVLIMLSSLSTIRYPILWSATIYLSYYTYITPAYIESMPLLWLEYIPVIGYAVYELMRIRPIDSGTLLHMKDRLVRLAVKRKY